MKKLTAFNLYQRNEKGGYHDAPESDPGRGVAVYLAADVDARIAELHRIVATLWNDVDPADYEDIRESVLIELAQRTAS
jgi:hypothetical protein